MYKFLLIFFFFLFKQFIIYIMFFVPTEIKNPMNSILVLSSFIKMKVVLVIAPFDRP